VGDRFAKVKADYGYGNLLRMVRGLANALSGTGDVPDGLDKLAEQLKSVGDDCAILYGAEVWRDELPGELIAALEALKDAIAKANPDAKAVFLSPVFSSVNSAGALLINHLDHFSGGGDRGLVRPAGSLQAVLKAAASGQLKALLVVDSDVLSTYPDRQLAQRALENCAVYYVGPFDNPTARLARYHIPLGSWAHREGTVLSMEWRLQKRTLPQLTDIAPSVLEIVNSLAGVMGFDDIAPMASELYGRLGGYLPWWSKSGFEQFPTGGEVLDVKPAGDEQVKLPGTELPAEVKGTADQPLVVIPKRFLYNDREELRHCPVFDKVSKPFRAFINPLDLKVYNLEDRQPVKFSAGGYEFELEVRAAHWVRQGSMVVNDYFLDVPANQICGREPVRISAARGAAVSGS
jgi:hypothetical protein